MRPSRRLPWLIAVCLAVTAPGTLAHAERPRIYALTGGTVVASPGKTIENGTVLIRDGLLEAVGADLDVPADATEIDVSGKWVYPGLIDAGGFTVSGEEASGSGPGRPSSQGRQSEPEGPVHPISRIRAERHARDRLLPFDGDRKKQAENLRKQGFTAVLVAPEEGIFRGQSAVVLAHDDRPVREILLADDVWQHVALERGRFGQGYPTSLMGAVAAVRQTFLDARRDAVWRARYEENPAGMARPETLPTLASLNPLLAREQSAVFEVEDPGDAMIADRIAKEFGIDAVILASGFEWEIADRIAATGRPLIFPVAGPDKPKVKEDDEALDVTLRDLRRYLDAPAGPARLHDAGVRFALTLRGLKNQADFPKLVREAIEAGLPEETALASLTTVPAELLGIDRVAGTLEAGKMANLFVTEGELFAEKTEVVKVFIEGLEYPVEKKKKPEGDPNAVVDPRGTWSVVFDMFGGTVQREWTIEGEKGDYRGTAETRSGTVTFDRVELVGNMLTVVFPATGQRGSSEVTVIIKEDSFEGTAEFGSRSVAIEGTRTSGPEGGGR